MGVFVPLLWQTCAVACSSDKPAVIDTSTACEDGGWSESPDDYIHVSSAEGTDDGNGSCGAPLLTISKALELVATGEAKALALWPGSYEEDIRFGEDGTVEGTYNGVSIVGAGEDDVEVVGSIHISAANDVVLSGFRLNSTVTAIRISGGAIVSIRNVSVAHASVAGVVIDGHETLVDVANLQINATDRNLG